MLEDFLNKSCNERFLYKLECFDYFSFGLFRLIRFFDIGFWKMILELYYDVGVFDVLGMFSFFNNIIKLFMII